MSSTGSRRRLTLAILQLMVVLIGASACGSSAPTSASALPAGRPQPTTLAINGSTSLARIGDTSQLSLSARWPDGTVRTVTTDARWTSSNTSVARITAEGLLTAVGLGLTTLEVSYGPLTKSIPVIVTPAGTVVVSGRVREPGSGGIANV